jgi:hypothetical protein
MVGRGKSDLRQFLFDHAVRTRTELAAAGKEAVSSRTRWRLPTDYPDALPLAAEEDAVRVLNSPAAVLVVVAGAGQAGVSAVVETFEPRAALRRRPGLASAATMHPGRRRTRARCGAGHRCRCLSLRSSWSA